MSYNNLLSLLSPQRREFIYKINNEMYNNALVNSDGESIKDYFFSLVRKNKELSGNEKKYSKKKFIYEFELSNAIYESGKPRECNECGSTRYSDRFCESCISLQLQSLFITWTSGNSIINDFIQQCQIESSLPGYILEWIPFEQFGDITKLADGGFSSIYTATWTRGAICDYNENKKEFSYFGNQEVILKSLNNSNNPGKSFFYEAINYCKIKSSTIVPCYGITKFPDYGNYAIVLSYAPEGNLRNYLQKNHSDLTLKNKITIFRYLCDALYWIHEKDLIHCDLHSGNILLQGGCCYITDLGLCGPVDEKSSNKIYGIISYVAPELLKGKINTKNTKETDIYSVGMLMWEIFAGHPPFDDRAHDHHLIFDICEGLQPPILPEMPDDYAEIMQKCWDMDPSKRPTIEELFDFAEKKLKEVHTAETLKNNRNSLIKKLFRFSKIKKHEIGFNNYNRNSSGSIGKYSRYSQRVHKSHPDAYHISRILDEEITKFKILNSYSFLNVDINKDYRNNSEEKEDKFPL